MNKKFIFIILISLLLCSSIAYAQGCDSDTQFLNHFDCADGSADAPDENCDGSGAHTITWGGAECDSGQTKWDNTGLFDGATDEMTLPDSPDWDIYGTTTGDASIDMWIYPTALDDNHRLLTTGASDSSSVGFYQFYVASTGLMVVTIDDDQAGNDNAIGTAGDIVVDTWQWVAMIKVGGSPAHETGIYIDGPQKAYISSTRVTQSTQTFKIGWNYRSTDPFGQDWFDGNIDEFRIQEGNYFSAAPNATPDDSVTAPTEAYSAAAGGNNTQIIINMVKALWPDVEEDKIFDLKKQFVKHMDKRGYARHRWPIDKNDNIIGEVIID